MANKKYMYEEYIGKKFNGLTILTKRLNCQPGEIKKAAKVKAKCDCGEIIYTQVNTIKNGGMKSCSKKSCKAQWRSLHEKKDPKPEGKYLAELHAKFDHLIDEVFDKDLINYCIDTNDITLVWRLLAKEFREYEYIDKAIDLYFGIYTNEEIE